MESPCISPPQFVLEAGENFSLKPWASSFHPSAQRLSTVQLRMKSSLQTGVCLSAFRSKHVAQFWPYLVHACATCLCWPLKDDLPPLCDFFFFCRYFRCTSQNKLPCYTHLPQGGYKKGTAAVCYCTAVCLLNALLEILWTHDTKWSTKTKQDTRDKTHFLLSSTLRSLRTTGTGQHH